MKEKKHKGGRAVQPIRIAIINYIQQHPKATARQISEIFNVNVKFVQNSKQYAKSHGIEIPYKSGYAPGKYNDAVRRYMLDHPTATASECAKVLNIRNKTVSNMACYMRKIGILPRPQVSVGRTKRLSPAQIQEIAALSGMQYSTTQIAKRLNISTSTAWKYKMMAASIIPEEESLYDIGVVAV